MMRWILFAVLAVALTATATVVLQFLQGEATPTVSAHSVDPAAKAKGPQPRAVVEGELIYKFGSKAQNIKFERDFVIKNEGQADLTLRLQAPPCSCTVAGFQSKVNEPSTTEKVVPPKG